MKLLLHTDGGSRGNPGPAGYGYVVEDITKPGAAIVRRKCGNYCGETTNNQAEYRGLIAGLTWIIATYPAVDELRIVMDSLLIVNQVKGLYRVKNEGLALRHREVKELLSHFSNWSISHTLRAGNSTADELVNRAIDLRRQVTP